MQQWGVTDHISGNATKIVQFPLAYTTFSHWVANSRSSSTNESSWCTGGYNGTLTGFTARSNGTEIEWIATGLQQWGIWNDDRSAGQIQCTFPVSNTKETLAILATYFDNTDVSNSALLIKETTLSTCKIKLWSSTKISFWVIGYQSYNSISYCSPKSIEACRT